MFGRDRRTEKRTPADVRAGIIGARPKVFPCSIENLSLRGAKIQIRSEWILPTQFSLVGSTDRRDTLRCLLVWRKGNYVGVRLSPRLD